MSDLITLEGAKTKRRSPSAASDASDIITEDAAVSRFAALHGDKLRYCHDTGSWFVWNGYVWEQNRDSLAFELARELARDLAKTKPTRSGS